MSTPRCRSQGHRRTALVTPPHLGPFRRQRSLRRPFRLGRERLGFAPSHAFALDWAKNASGSLNLEPAFQFYCFFYGVLQFAVLCKLNSRSVCAVFQIYNTPLVR